MCRFIVTVKENESDAYLGPFPTSMMEHFWENIERLEAFTYVCKNTLSWNFNRVLLNMPLQIVKILSIIAAIRFIVKIYRLKLNRNMKKEGRIAYLSHFFD